ncbi:hypothetical protein L226DRAFT_91823 [Lentinus tigrinus ALCF2SS1-7]|uniref:LPXTG-domain-containing protein n=1 Tax=Lentinus tigrinus ALCF2SS1-6 TaxID=1328759 RepID=A0A5C2RYS0_9APHY|nr:hypothetical protein L227DRAFT_288235 [Lentinus tigrinus ALCF2SS1-6]RPD73959.1 hypothetical protein L226DRAFT_91823 [Lentinus tigrinus ALCF2SS1-7]
MVRLAHSSLAFVLATAAISCIPGVHAGNTTCASNQLDWYTSVVGETPCDTYQRLRRICNPDYEVPGFRPDTPGDQCNDQVSACCCNTVAFQLSMLCMNCQYDTVNGDISSGIDAGVGAYSLYKGTCGVGTNHSLPTDVQKAACNENIRLDDFLYGGWDDGSWFYIFTKQNAAKDHAANNNNTFTHCPDHSSSSSYSPTAFYPGGSNGAETTSSITSSDTSIPTTIPDSSSNTTHRSNAGAIVGGVLGAVAGLLLLGGLYMFWRGRRNRKSRTQLYPSRHTSYSSPMLSSVLPSSSIGAFRAESLRPSLPSDEGGSSDMGHTTESWGRRMSSYNTDLGTMASMESLRHEDAGLIELFRSASDRLPPAYRSWGNQPYMFGPGMETQDSESQGYQARQERRSVRDLPPPPTTRTYMPDDHVRNMPLAPLRRVPTRAY